jgi:DNA processing protein
MSVAETAALVALLRAGRQPPHIYSALVEERGSALAVLEEEEGGANSRLPALFKDEAMHELLATATADLARWRDQDVRLLTVLDAEYPENLRSVHDRPPLIFLAGALHRHHTRSIAVVGARHASPEGLAHAAAIAEHLVDHDFTVVSGLAAGIDTAAHTAALDAGGRTVAVIGTGLNHAFPPQNARLQRRIAQRHAVISQFDPETGPSRQTFPARNATMSGLALAAVVVEASYRSGARGQAHRALNHGRPVFLAPALLDQPWARELARRPGVHVATSSITITETVERLTATGALVA